MSKKWLIVVAILGVGTVPASAAEPHRGYHKKVAVTEPTRIDWTFAVSNRSLASPPADWLPDYDSTQQHYELFVPANYNPKQAYPLVLYISPGNEPAAWGTWETPCKQLGMMYAGVYGAGNDCPPKKRVRIALDVLDELRRQYKIDPERTYLAGFSGGGRMACAVAFALPEYFGGVIPICAGGDLRTETWLRHRVIDRLSVAFVTGETDFNRGEVERFRGPFLKEVGVRSRVWVYPKLGHGIPSGQQLLEVVRWLDQGVPQRRDLGKRYPATPIAGDAAPTPDEWARSILDEGKKRLESEKTLYTGLMLLQGCSVRWTGLRAAAEAKKILSDYDSRKDRPWEKEDIAEQRRFLIANARALDAYASGPLPQQYAKMRGEMARTALELWQQVQQDGQDEKAVQEAKKRIPTLQKLLDTDKDDK